MPSVEEAARNHVQPIGAGDNNRPKKCHDAVLGWILMALGYPKAWQLLRRATARLPHGAGPFGGLDATWMWNNIYSGVSTQLTRVTVATLAMPGDVLWAGGPGIPTHSMIVVGRQVGAAGAPTRVNVRGFNNQGTFAHAAQQLNLLPPQQDQYDPVDRDVANAVMWPLPANPASFGIGSLLFHVPGFIAKMRISQAFPWEGSTLPIRCTPRWHHNVFQGWHWG